LTTTTFKKLLNFNSFINSHARVAEWQTRWT
jgi:hypothetical protein